MPQCKGITKNNNTQCSRKAKPGSEFCAQHSNVGTGSTVPSTAGVGSDLPETPKNSKPPKTPKPPEPSAGGTGSSSNTSGIGSSERTPKPPKVELNLDFDIERYELDIVNINETTNMIVLMNSVMKLVKHIEELNPKFDFKKYLTITEYKSVKKALHKFICNERRVYLIIDYAFLNPYRGLMEPFSFYAVNFLTDDEKRIFYSFMPRGYTGTVPKRDNFGESSTPFSASSHSSFFNSTSSTSKKKEPPKAEKEPPPPKTKSEKKTSVPPKTEEKKDDKVPSDKVPSTPSLSKVLEELKKLLPGKNAATYLKLIMTSTNDLSYTRKEIMDLFREFHPDKAGSDPKAVQLCTLVSSKISLLKKKLDSSSSPTRPIGNLYLDVCKILIH